MLNERGISFAYREYRDEPLDESEIRDVLAKLGCGPRDVLRPKEAKANGITDSVTDDELIAAMASNPTLLQRPICIDGDRALLARPAETLNDFLASS